MSYVDTIAVHAGEPAIDRKDAPVTPDITVGSASGYPDLKTLDTAMAEHRGYGRWGTENHRQLEAAVASLESNGLQTRLEALAVGSGMAAIAVALMSEMNAGDHVVAAHDCYGTTLTFVRDDLSRFGITSSIVDFQDLDAVKRAVTDRTRVLLCEMCTNPLIRVPDLEALAGIAHEAGALLVVDNTVPTSALSQPLRWGADVVIYSATKNLSGHADVIGGVIVGKPTWIDAARAFAHTFGPTLGPFDAWLTLRGIRTLAVRMHRQRAPPGPVSRGASRRQPRQLPGAGEKPLLRSSPKAAAGWGRRLAVLRAGRRHARPGVDDPAAPARPVDAQPRQCRDYDQPPDVDLPSGARRRGANAGRHRRGSCTLLSRNRAS